MHPIPPISRDLIRNQSLYRRTIYLYTPKINRLMREASIRSRKAGEKGISAKNIRRVTEVSATIPVSRLPTTNEQY
ncbi:conserved hypothetical protein [Talaromyces marneffei ATCC 18224]|uniref:Uncharacterized protein n=1 Tax=Talaromyces marneffei (strain ATCC 18224 / CBS 334.59 / QM 7333) TaxID=441960 RepID=B6QIF0_TALMQ|nr:conserved hypothetical protein [Talaromyces marneffei ATCC 18224]